LTLAVPKLLPKLAPFFISNFQSLVAISCIKIEFYLFTIALHFFADFFHVGPAVIHCPTFKLCASPQGVKRLQMLGL
jgi:hypothetical protein